MKGKLAILAAALFAALISFAAGVSASAQPLHLNSESVRNLRDRGGALGVVFVEERVVAEATEIAALAVKQVIQNGSTLRVGDVIIAVNDRTAGQISDLRPYVRSLRPGQNVSVTVLRAGSAAPEKIDVVVSRFNELRIPGVEPPPSPGQNFAKSCVAGAVAGAMTAGITALLAVVDGGVSFGVLGSKAIIGALIGCAAVGAGGAVAAEAVPSQGAMSYRRLF